MFFSQHFSFPCQYHSTIAPYTLIHLPPTLYNVFLPALQFSPVSIIPPLLHTHSFIYHPRCIMFLSQHFSFPLSVSFHQCPIIFMFPLPGGQLASPLNLSKISAVSETWYHCVEEYFQVFLLWRVNLILRRCVTRTVPHLLRVSDYM